MKRHDLVPAPAVKPVLVTAVGSAPPSSTGGPPDATPPPGSVVCVVPPARRFSPITTTTTPTSALASSSGAPGIASGSEAVPGNIAPNTAGSAAGIVVGRSGSVAPPGSLAAPASVTLQPLRHILPPVVTVPTSASSGGGASGPLQRNILTVPLSTPSTVAPQAPPHLLTALAQAAAGPHLSQYRRGVAPPLAAHSGAQAGSASSLPPGVCGENLSVRRDAASSSPFLLGSQQQQIQVTQSSVQSGLSGTAHAQMPAQRRTHPVLTPMMTNTNVPSASSSSSAPSSALSNKPTPSPAPAVPPSASSAAVSVVTSLSSDSPAVVSSSAPLPSTETSGGPPAEGQSGAASAPSGYHRLRVEDALSYLDQVKSKFQNHPEVYNDFLDIMKEFKAQNIDTPGVITRVSSLFRGHPALIVGFNTFLPPGYRIEVQSGNDYLHVSMTAPGQVTTVVHTPTGGLQTYHDQSSDGCTQPRALPPGCPGSSSVSSSTKLAPVNPGAAPVSVVTVNAAGTSGTAVPAGGAQNTQMQFRNSYGTNNIVSGHLGCGSSGGGGGGSGGGVNIASLHSYTQHQQLPSTSNHQLSTSGVSTGPGSGGSNGGGGGSGGGVVPGSGASNSNSQPVEFKHAINYVNKIKNRFQGQPEVYKQFLEILHTYQKEQRCAKEGGGGVGSGGGGGGVAASSSAGTGGQLLSETEVYAKVAALFHKHSDLMDEFGQFLPDATNDTAFTAVSNSRSVNQDGNRATACTSAAVNTGSTLERSGALSDKPQPSSTASTTTKSAALTVASGNVPSSSSLPFNVSGIAAGLLHHSPPGSRQLKRPSSNAAAGQQQQQQQMSVTAAGCGLGAGAGGGAVAPPAPKRPRVGVLKDVTLAEAAKYGTLNDFAFFDQVRKTLRNQDLYNNFLRVLSLYNAEVISRYDVIQLVTPFIGRKPGLLKWLKEFMGVKDGRDDAVGGVGGVGSNPGAGQFSASLTGTGGHHTTADDESGRVTQRAGNMSDLTVEIDPSTCKRLGASYCALPKTYLQPRCSGRNQLCRDVLNDVWVSFPSYSEDSTFVTSRKTLYEEYIYRCEDERFELDMVLETNLATIRILEGIQKRLQRMSSDEAARYRLDDCLGGTSPTIHQRAVRRVYGDKAGDIIDGLKKNPLVAVPVVLRRLKAKQNEWKEAQKGYNKVWREQNEKYYLKSLDPQGINFKQSDIKQLRSKQLLHELYQLFDERSEQQLAEEEATPPATPQYQQPQPHMQLVYSSWHVLDDAADLIVHHVKRLTCIHKEDKSKIKRLVRHTLAGMFHQTPRPVESDEEDNEADDTGTESSQPPNKKKKKEPKDQEEEMVGGERTEAVVADVPEDRYTLFMASSNWYVFLRLHQILCERLCCIQRRAGQLLEEERRYRPLRTESAATALRLKPSNEIEVEDYYPAFLDMIKCVLDNSMDSNQYEDTLREMFGTHAYHAFTADKIVSGAVRQLQYIVTENAAQLTLSEYLTASAVGGTGGTCSSAQQRQMAEHSYMKRVEQLLTDENEHCMKIYLFNRDGRMTVELLDTTDSEDSDDATNTANNNNNGTGGGGTTARSSSSKTTTAAAAAVGAGSTFADDKLRATYQETFTDAVETNSGAVGRSGALQMVFLARNIRRTAPKIAASSADAPSSTGDTTVSVKQEPLGEEDSDMPVDNNSANLSALDHQIKPASTPPPPTDTASGDLTLCDNEQIRLDAGSSRMTRVAKTGSLLARRYALTRAKQLHRRVSECMNGRFRAWHQRWADTHLTGSQRSQCDDWLMGRQQTPSSADADNQTDSNGGGGWVTVCRRNNDTSRPPYSPYTRYCVTSHH